ncbi:hypothetical protein VPH35_042274 [Triticum aestivum]|uniref:Uncharacterized protein n=1 Tax=Triticum urartu TaxID=4572 RepID=A0A8R7PNJ8_TRIUA
MWNCRSLARPGEVEVAAGEPPGWEVRGEAERLLVVVEHHQLVLHLEPPDHHRRRRAPSAASGLHEREARRAAVHLRHGVAAHHREVRPALQHHVHLRDGVARQRRRQLGRVVAQLERRHGRHLRARAHGAVEGRDEGAVHVAAELRVGDRGGEADDERAGAGDGHARPVDGDAVGG